jgi:hypothetical protein
MACSKTALTSCVRPETMLSLIDVVSKLVSLLAMIYLGLDKCSNLRYKRNERFVNASTLLPQGQPPIWRTSRTSLRCIILGRAGQSCLSPLDVHQGNRRQRIQKLRRPDPHRARVNIKHHNASCNHAPGWNASSSHNSRI